jgi:hypothetical protein
MSCGQLPATRNSSPSDIRTEKTLICLANPEHVSLHVGVSSQLIPDADNLSFTTLETFDMAMILFSWRVEIPVSSYLSRDNGQHTFVFWVFQQIPNMRLLFTFLPCQSVSTPFMMMLVVF